MNCPSCGASSKGKFCKNCGTSLYDDKNSQDMETGSVLEVIAATPLKRLVKAILISSTLITLLIAAVSFVLNWIVSKGSFFNDLSYHLLKNVIDLPPEQAAFFAQNLKPGFWLHYVLLHGASINGEYTAVLLNSSDPMTSAFSVQLPLLLNLALLFLFISVLTYAGRRLIVGGTFSTRVLWTSVLGVSLVYSVLSTLLALIVQPESKFVFGHDQFTLGLRVDLVSMFLTGFLISFVAAFLGLGGLSLLRTEVWKAWAKSLRSFFVVMTCFWLLIGSLMMVNWGLGNARTLHSSEIVTVGSLWESYNDDPAFYALLPNIWLQEQVYSLGGTWHVTGDQAARLLHAPGPFQLNAVTGISEYTTESLASIGQEDEALIGSLQVLETDIRFAWYHAAFLILYLFALSQIRMKSMAVYAATTIGVIAILSAISVFFRVGISVQSAERQWIGYSFVQTATSIGSVTVLFLLLSYGIQHFIRKRGQQ